MRPCFWMDMCQACTYFCYLHFFFVQVLCGVSSLFMSSLNNLKVLYLEVGAIRTPWCTSLMQTTGNHQQQLP